MHAGFVLMWAAAGARVYGTCSWDSGEAASQKRGRRKACIGVAIRPSL